MRLARQFSSASFSDSLPFNPELKAQSTSTAPVASIQNFATKPVRVREVVAERTAEQAREIVADGQHRELFGPRVTVERDIQQFADRTAASVGANQVIG